MTIWDKYSNKIPDRPKYQDNKELFDNQKEQWLKSHSAVIEDYKKELFELTGLSNHPNKDKIYTFCLALEDIYDQNGIYDTRCEKPIEVIMKDLVSLFI